MHALEIASPLESKQSLSSSTASDWGVPLLQVGIRPSGGLRLWDIRFNGERIVYELALQEAMMSAGGNTPSQVRAIFVCSSSYKQIIDYRPYQMKCLLGTQALNLTKIVLNVPLKTKRPDIYIYRYILHCLHYTSFDGLLLTGSKQERRRRGL